MTIYTMHSMRLKDTIWHTDYATTIYIFHHFLTLYLLRKPFEVIYNEKLSFPGFRFSNVRI